MGVDDGSSAGVPGGDDQEVFLALVPTGGHGLSVKKSLFLQ